LYYLPRPINIIEINPECKLKTVPKWGTFHFGTVSFSNKSELTINLM